jgi:hypothetical protein
MAWLSDVLFAEPPIALKMLSVVLVPKTTPNPTTLSNAKRTTAQNVASQHCANGFDDGASGAAGGPQQ